jgi:hypothetical protein
VSNTFTGGPGFSDPRVDNHPLTDQEQQLQQRLLSDPIGFPMIFKSWMVSYLEISDLALGQSNVVGLTTALGTAPGMTGNVGLLNTGTCVVYAGATLPPNVLVCNGGAYDTTVYADLFKAIGYRHGGSGAVFNVPNIPAPVANTQWVIVT